MKNSLLCISMSMLLFNLFTQPIEQESNLKKAIRYSKTNNPRDRSAYESYVKLYRFRLANGTAGTMLTDLDKSIRNCFSGHYESQDIKHLCLTLAIDARVKKPDSK
jgi:hypothetical protein